MDAIHQLKTMRDEAHQRLQSNADFKVLNSLENLIGDLEKLGQVTRPQFTVVEEIEIDEPNDVTEVSTEAVEDALEQMTAEINGETEGDDDRGIASLN